MDYQYQAVEQPSNPRKTWPIVLSVVVALTVACGAGVYVYHAKQQEALASCRQSVAEFSAARKAILDTSDNSSELQKVLRDVLGVDDILDAFADAATSAEGTVDVEGCKANATITQLNLVAKTLDSATDSLNASLKGLKLQKPGRKTSAYIFIFLSGSFWAHWRLFSKISVLFEVPVFSKVVSITS